MLDASALFVFLQKKPGAVKVAALLKEAVRNRANLVMSAVNYGEVYGALLRAYGQDTAASHMSAVRALPILILDVNQQRAFHAAEVKSTYNLYYVDSFAAALAMEHKATLVTSNSDFRKLGHNFSTLWLHS